MNLAFCDGGLCNRLNVLIFALILRGKYGHDWHLSWPRNTWCGAGFNRLFELDAVVHDHPITFYKEHEQEFAFLIHENQGEFAEELVTFNGGFAEYAPYEQYLSSHSQVFYYNNLIPKFADLNDIKVGLSSLSLNRQVLEKATEFCRANSIDETVYGLHIRKTDFGDKINDQELFQVVATRAARFFVCSDDEEVNNRFAELANCAVFKKNHFPQKRLESANWLHWVTDAEGRKFPFNIERSEESVVEGLIDLLILSRTQLVTTSHSTFLTMAGIFKRVGFF
jgi:hypothetical protein